MQQQMVRFGSLGWIGLFQSALNHRFPVRARVVCQSARGLEIGEVLSDEPYPSAQTVAGTILRTLSDADELLWHRLERHRDRALRSCDTKLREQGVAATLLDAELTFDGQHLYFYFLGEVPSELEPLLAELSELYQAKIHYRRFVEAMEVGCGPDCGTGVGCSQGTCGTCPASGACGSRRPAATAPDSPGTT